MNPVLVRLFEHNRWANLALVDACLGMDRSVVERAVDGTFGAIRPTLAHIAGAEERYLLALEGEQRDAAAPFETTDPSLTDIRIHLDRSGRGLVEVAGRLDGDPTLTGTHRGAPYAMPASLFLLQAVNHATEHRAQIATTLTQLGIEPPVLDGWAFTAAGS